MKIECDVHRNDWGQGCQSAEIISLLTKQAFCRICPISILSQDLSLQRPLTAAAAQGFVRSRNTLSPPTKLGEEEDDCMRPSIPSLASSLWIIRAFTQKFFDVKRYITCFSLIRRLTIMHKSFNSNLKVKIRDTSGETKP